MKSVLVTLGMNNADYLAKAKQAAQATEDLEAAQAALGDRLMSQEQAMQHVGTQMTVAGAALTAFALSAVMTSSKFESAMSSVQSATMAPAEQMGILRDAALEAGQSTVFTATEAAAGIEELGKAGLSTSNILGGALTGALDLAAAGELSVADAAEQTATTLSQFKLAGDKAVHVADLLAAGAGKAQGSVGDLGQALNQSGLVASQMGLSVEETVGSLTAFANAGLLGSDAGTSFRTMLMRLTNPSGEAADMLTELGIQTRNANGEFIGMSGLAGQLQSKMKDLSPAARDAAMAIIFGQDAIRAANVLYAEGEEGIAGWISQVDDSGYAAQVASARLDNLGGDVEEMTGAWETAMIRIGSSAQGPLRQVVQSATEMVNAIGDADPAMQGAFLTATALAGGILLIGGSALVIIPQVAATQAALVSLGITAAATRAAVVAALSSPVAVAVVAAAAAVAGLEAASRALSLSTEEAENKLKGATDAATLFQTVAKADQKLFEGYLDEQGMKQLADLPQLLTDIRAQADEPWKFGEFFDTGFWDAKSRLKEMGEALADLDPLVAAEKFKILADETDGSTEQLTTLLGEMPAYRDALLEQANAQGVVIGDLETLAGQQQLARFATEQSTPVVDDYSEALSGQASQAEDASGAIAGLAEELSNYNSILYDSLGAEMDYFDAVDQAREGLEDFNEQLDEGETLVDGMTGKLNLQAEGGRNAMQSLMDVGQATRDYAADLWNTTGSAEQMQAALQSGWDQVYDLGLQMGLSEEQARAYADQLVGIPDQVATEIVENADEARLRIGQYVFALGTVPGSIVTQIGANTDGAQGSIDTFINNNNGRVITIYTNTASGTQEIRSNGAMTGKAAGGAIHGPGPKGVDSMPFMLAPGEHVLTARDVDMLGGQDAVYRMRELIQRGAFQGLALGGDPYGGWGQVASQSNVSYSSPSYASTNATDSRQFTNNWQIDGATKFDVRDLVDEMRRVMRDEAEASPWK
ncbi:phage tail tape measure protein [Pseudoclavibacter sp. VKM Ac-2888]|uniref:phage tail tape measure protein n=1 Tax=Pseudoclavibacter sp. VKM Ac-2888 TaxID=2783830 RepID=UPI00188CECC1|nr:phage tail tape measure protein [Pseudoclavibacter sp. VKM Ac-2888]MBF4549667.1 phage tail tape measure protein [Pseudoclavibacter sp. VKM Ac-2888]